MHKCERFSLFPCAFCFTSKKGGGKDGQNDNGEDMLFCFLPPPHGCRLLSVSGGRTFFSPLFPFVSFQRDLQLSECHFFLKRGHFIENLICFVSHSLVCPYMNAERKKGQNESVKCKEKYTVYFSQHEACRFYSTVFYLFIFFILFQRFEIGGDPLARIKTATKLKGFNAQQRHESIVSASFSLL